MVILGTVVLSVLVGFAVGQDANCDYAATAKPGETYYVYSRGYPNNYTGELHCRWISTCPSGYRCRLYCPDINLPASPSCSLDRLLISRSGDPQLNNPDVYCGKGSTTVYSTGQKISVGLITSPRTSGGKFYCELTAVATTPTTPPPSTCSCGYKKSNRIVGGQETGVNEYPMMAGVVYADQEDIRCGGTIIAQRYVMTAAHCVVTQTTSNLIVIVGEHDTTVGDSPATRGYAVERVLIHPQYNSSNNDYDIALLRVSRDIEFSDRVGPACLPFKFRNTDFTGSQFTLLGWGTQVIGGPKSKQLLKVNVDVVSQGSCQRVVPALTPRQICTYTPGKDACQDDSGGPALFTDPATGLLHVSGVISFGRLCAQDGQPGVHTRVTTMIDWVQSSTSDVRYCWK